MKHDVAQDLLSSYLDGDLSPQERDQVDEHLTSCARCREELAMLRLTLDALHDLPELTAPVGFTDAVMQRIGEEASTVDETSAASAKPVAPSGQAKVVPIDRERRWRVPVWAPVALAAAACVAVGMVWWVQSWRWGADETFAPTASKAEFSESMGADALADAEMAGERDARPVLTPEPLREDELDGVAEAEVVAQLERWAEPNDAPAVPAGPAGGLATTRTATGESGAYYAPWEKGDGDALADAIEPTAAEPEEASREAIVSDTRRQLPSGSSLGVIDNTGTVEEREKERLAREEEAFRALYGGDGDAVADSGVFEEDDEDSFASAPDAVQARGAYTYEGEPEPAEEARPSRDESAEDADHDRYRTYDDADLLGDTLDDAVVDISLDVAEVEEEDFERKSATRSESVGRSLDRSRSGGGRATRKKKSESDEAQAAVVDATTEVLSGRQDAEQPAAEPSVASPPAASAPLSTAEWTLQTTEPAVLYRMAELCAEGLSCTWSAPNSGPVSLNAQQNYQIVAVTLPKAAYELLQARLRAHGSLLVRTEDIALASVSDPVTIRLVIEYLP